MKQLFGKTCVVCFDPREIEAFRAELRHLESDPFPWGESPLWRGTLAGIPISVVRLPFGDRIPRLEKAVLELIDREKPTALIGCGTAMACSHDLPIGTIVFNRKAHFGARAKRLNDRPIEEFQRILPRDLTLVEGDSITSPVFVNSPEQFRGTMQTFPEAAIIEMEDFHIGRLAKEHGIPFLSFRAISDYGNFDDHISRITGLAFAVIRVLVALLGALRQNLFLLELANPACRDLPFQVLVKSRAGELSIPEAIHLARRLSRAFQLSRWLKPGARLDIHMTGQSPSRRQKIGKPYSPSGKAWVMPGDGGTLWIDRERTFAGIFTSRVGVGTLETLRPDLAGELKNRALRKVSLPPPEEKRGRLPILEKVHIQGLNSISAEAEEGLLACTTIEEFLDHGVEVVDSETAKFWIYRTAHAAEASYFVPDYEAPMRKGKPAGPDTYLIATGLGPAIKPEAAGGSEADALVLGDEQGGRLIHYLNDLSLGNFGPSEVFRYRGVAQRITPTEVALSRLDRRFVLSDSGLNALSYRPESLRMVYSDLYDEFLGNYFQTGTNSAKVIASYLLLTSRGCGNECSICCSGGHQPFSCLRPEVVADILQGIRSRHSLKKREVIQVFFLDSNFNKSAERVMALADMLEKRDLLKDFTFQVRHNGLQGFVSSFAAAGRPPRVNRGLIDAYRQLGIEEIVLGIDAYTETSIRLLKTPVARLLADGENAVPSYRFEDIRAVLGAIEKEGMKSRGFLLMNNPFTGDIDRIETFYNLLRLAIEAPNFTIDYDSSTRVNDLKPFPGAPLTRIARKIPGLVVGDKFALDSKHGEIEPFLRFDLFKFRRTNETRTHGFLASAQEVRFGLGDFFFSLVKKTPYMSSLSPDLIGAMFKFIEEDRLVQPLFEPLIRTVALLSETEEQVRDLGLKLRRELRQHGLSDTNELPRPERKFFRLLRETRAHE